MFFFSSRRRHTRCALVTGVQTCALPILSPFGKKISSSATQKPLTFKERWTLHASHQNGVNCPWNGAEKWKSLSSPFGLNSHSHPAPFSPGGRSEEHTSELQSLMRISYAVFCLKKKQHNHNYYNS